jgi:hypothetical protein
MAKNASPIEVSDEDMSMVEEIRLAENLTKKDVVHQAINRYYNKWRCS